MPVHSVDEQERLRREAEDAQERARKEAEESRLRRLEEGRQARETLLDQLEGFASAVGHIQVQRTESDLVLSYRGNQLRFLSRGEGDEIELDFEGAKGGQHTLHRMPELEDRWVWSREIAGRPDRVPFSTQGLEILMTGVLKLPRPA